MTIDINDMKFKTKRVADSYIKHLLSKYGEGEKFNQTDMQFILDSIKYREKYGDGVKILSSSPVKKIFKRVTYDKTPLLFIVQTNGNTIEVNYNKFYSKRKLNKYNNTPQMNKFIKACRYEVSKHGKNNGKDIVNHHDATSFRELIEEFIKNKKIDVNKIKMNNLTNDVRHVYYKDKDFAKEWLKFHDKKANITKVSKTLHSKLHRGKYVKRKII